MKKMLLTATTGLLIAAFAVGCSKPQAEEPVDTTVSEMTMETTEKETVSEPTKEVVNEPYSEQIGRYYTPLLELWDVNEYIENDLSTLPSAYCEGNPLENVGYGLVDLDNDGAPELVIGAILNADTDPTVFEIWTMVDGEPVMVAQSNSESRYILQYPEEEEMWYIVREDSDGIAFCATYYITLNEGACEIVQGVVYNVFADEENPWFMTYDLDEDVSNDMPIDEDTANAILSSNQKYYKTPKYISYKDYQSMGTSS